MKKETQLSLERIKDQKFDLTEREREVLEALKEAQEAVAGFKEQAAGPEGVLKDTAIRLLPRMEVKMKALSQPADQVVSACRRFYEKTIELAGTGLDEGNIAFKMYEEFPNLPDYYGLLRMKPWGYHLGQLVINAKIHKGLKKS